MGNENSEGNTERKIMIFKTLIRSILLYAAEIWGWTETEKIHKVDTRLDFNTPAYIILEETKIEKIRIEAGKRAQKYEEMTRTER